MPGDSPLAGVTTQLGDLSELGAELVGAVQQTMQPEVASLWLRPRP